MSTLKADFAFVPKVWQDHVSAYFNRKLVWGALALKDTTLVGAPGETVNFPYYKAIGDAEEPDEDSGLSVDKLQDDSFSCTIKEVAKAVGVKRSALRKSAATRERIFSEVQSQQSRVHAEKVDKDLVTLATTAGNYTDGFVGTANTDTMTIRVANSAKVIAFGDRHTDAIAWYMHSMQFKDLYNDTTAGFLNLNANDPFYAVPGFQGRVLGMAVVVSDSCPKSGSQIGGLDAYESYIFKANPFGLMTGEEMDMEQDYDMLHREYLFAATQRYGVTSLHGKISSLDKRACRLLTPVKAS